MRGPAALLPAGSDLRGRVAVANAQRAYARYRDRFGDDRWAVLQNAGARAQRPLWASTGTKDPAYSDVLYVEELIPPDVINYQELLDRIATRLRRPVPTPARHRGAAT